MEKDKFMKFINVIKLKVKRSKEKLKDLEELVNSNVASNTQKQEYIRLKAQIEAYEDVIDLAEGVNQD